MAAVAATLTGRGHDVAWAGSESFLRPLLGDGATIYPIPLRAHRGQGERGMAATKSRWDGYIVPHARVTRDRVASAAEDFGPDVLVVDQHAVAGALVAHRYGLRWASAAPTSMELTRPYRALPKVEAWIHERLAAMWADAGLPGTPPHDLRFSPHLLIAFTGTALTGELTWPANARLVGPALVPRPPDPEFPWEWLDPQRRHVLVTMGTLSMDLAKGFYERVVATLRPLGDRLQAVVVAPDGAIGDVPEHLLVRRRVPVLDLMPHLDAVVSHGGLNTVCEALAHGVPLVVAPIKGDQPINARQVAAAGAGIRVSFDRIRPEALRGALLGVLDDPAYRAAADRIRVSFAAAGGAPAAADHLELLASRPGPHNPSTLESEQIRESVA
jgi:MGT family glycosyltransferase